MFYQSTALLNIEMIDVGRSIEIDVGNRTPEITTLRDDCVAGIIIDDLRYIGWHSQVHRRTECHDQSYRSAQSLHFFRHENGSVGSERISHDYRTFAAFLQTGRFRRELLIVL